MVTAPWAWLACQALGHRWDYLIGDGLPWRLCTRCGEVDRLEVIEPNEDGS